MSEAPKQRNARACETCRVSKTRCISKSDAGDCLRCEATGSQCIVRSKARPGRVRSVRPLGESTRSSKPEIFDDTEFSIDLPSVIPPNTERELVELYDHHRNVFFGNSESELVEIPHGEESQLVEKRQVTLQEAEKLLDIFRQMAVGFPFVQLAKDATCKSLAKTSPFTLLSMLTSASYKTRSLYHQLDCEFRRILSMKLIVEGRKSLDYLQGLLVYIAWYPVHISPKNNQSFMYMNLAISLVGDLGLDRDVPGPAGLNNINTDQLFDGKVFSTAAKRAYLGCYYLSSTLSIEFQKASNMHYRNLMDKHGETLLIEEDAVDILCIVKLQRIVQKVSDTYLSKENENSVSVDDMQLFLDEVQDWQEATPESTRKTPLIALAERSAILHIHSQNLGFLRRPYRMHLELSPNREQIDPSHFWSCLDTCKSVMEYILSLPVTTYGMFTVTQGSTLVHAILALSRLTFLMASQLSWDSETAQSTIPLVMYLDCLSYRFGQLTTTSLEGGFGTPDAPYIFKRMLESVKVSYQRRVAGIKPGFLVARDSNSVGIKKGHCPMIDPELKSLLDYTSFAYENSTNMSGTATSTHSSLSIPLYHDLWATMTGSWAES